MVGFELIEGIPVSAGSAVDAEHYFSFQSFYKPRESMWHWPKNVTSNNTFPVTLWAVSQTRIENPKN